MSIIEDVILSAPQVQQKTRYMPTAKMKLHPSNPRFIKDRDFDILCQSIQNNPEFFEARPLLCTPDLVVFAGNMRLRAAKALKLKHVPVIIMDVDEEKQRELMIRDNVNNGQWDTDTLAAGFEIPELLDWGVPAFIFGMDEEENDSEAGESVVNAKAVEDDYEIPDAIKTDIVPGDLFEIGPHRLLCGDSTTADDVDKVLNGEKADMVFTDPPYGVSVKGGKNKSNIAGDLTQTAIPFSFEMAVLVATKPIATFYFCGGEGNLGLYAKLFERYLSQIPRHLIWVKNGFVMKPNGYHNQYEIIFYGYKAGGGGISNWFGGRTEHEASDVWRVNRDAASSYEHPTQKPVELPTRAIRNSCPPQGLVFEPFGGSGSTVVAAHQLGRRCFAIEIDPQYCQVIVDRMLRLDPALEIKRNGKPYEYSDKSVKNGERG